jgi:hypothetical protein
MSEIKRGIDGNGNYPDTANMIWINTSRPASNRREAGASERSIIFASSA